MAGSAGLAATGCSSGSGSTGGTATVQLVVADDAGSWGSGGTQASWSALIGEFEQQNPDVKIDLTVFPRRDADRKVGEMLVAGKAPDIAQASAFAGYAANGRLYSADDVLSIPVQADFIPPLAQTGELRRVQYGMPFAASTWLFFYNKDLFAAADLDPEQPPQSWEELRDAADALGRLGVAIPYGLPLSFRAAPQEALLWMLSNGGDYADNVGAYVINSTQNVETFTWLRDELVGPGLAQAEPGLTERRDLYDLFAEGQVGMVNGSPELMRQADAKNVNYGVAQIPGKEGPAPATLGTADWMLAFRENGREEAVGKFLDFLYGEKSVRAVAERQQVMPVTTSGSEWMSEEEDYRQLWPFLRELPSARFAPVGRVTWANVSGAVGLRMRDAVLKGGDPLRVLSELQRIADALEGELRNV